MSKRKWRSSQSPVRVADLNDGACDPDAPDRLFCHANTLYSVCGLTDETGALREAYQYGPCDAPASGEVFACY